MNDYIEIKNLMLRTIIGIGEKERKDRQDIFLDILLTTDTKPANRTDSPESSVDYRSLCQKIVQMVERSSFRLMSALAEEVACICLSDLLVYEVKVTVEQPHAVQFAGAVAATITRSRLDSEKFTISAQ